MAQLTICAGVSGSIHPGFPADPVRVLIWDERQPAQKPTYDKWLGEIIGDHLDSRFHISHASLDSPHKGLAPELLDATDVLIWWGHVRHGEISPEEAAPVIERIREGKLALIALHSAHWATPFMEAMNEKTREIAHRKFSLPDATHPSRFEFIPPPGRTPPHASSSVTPFFLALGGKRSGFDVRVDLPNCCFPGWRADGKPSTMQVQSISHPIAQGLPLSFQLPSTEMYAEPFHVPEPDAVVFHETWDAGEWFRSGMVWNIGRGKVFYFRPGHETFPVYRNPHALKVIENAVAYLGGSVQASRLSQAAPNFSIPNLVAWCIVPFDSTHRSPAERVAMLQHLGLRRVAYDWRQEHVDSFETEILEYQKHHIEMTAFWDVHPHAFDLFRKYKMSPQIWKTAPSPQADSQAERVRLAAEILRPVVDECRSLGSFFGLYNHGGWGGQPENLIQVCEYIRTHFNAPHVGIVYNFHHAHDRIDDFSQFIHKLSPYLLCLNLNGMNAEEKPKILTIGSGTHEKSMIQAVLDSGYAGPIGIIDHLEQRDSLQVLQENILGLQEHLKP
ncbi:MAG: ThuA domain-containing protein [Verrucomicrobia bacterium]|nr:ThuA domain-containing protein [Verrucomicrobiota bacterium]